jgi:hypothetical protein
MHIDQAQLQLSIDRVPASWSMAMSTVRVSTTMKEEWLTRHQLKQIYGCDAVVQAM